MSSLILDPDGVPQQIISSWNRDDIVTAGNIFAQPELTEDEVSDVLRKLEDQFSAEVGINWEIIDCAIVDVIANREEK